MSEQNTSLVRKQLETSMALGGGLDGLMKSIDNPMLLIDTSGSMAGRPIENLRKVVTGIQAEGHVPMIAFGGPFDAQVRFVDRVPDADGGTPLHLAIPFAKEYGATRLVVVSDGQPDLREGSMDAAKAFGGRIDVIYVGTAGDGGSVFLEALAAATSGRRINADLSDVKRITSTVIAMLEGEVAPARSPIQGPGFTSAPVEAPDVDEDNDDTDDDEDDTDDTDDDDEDDTDDEDDDGR